MTNAEPYLVTINPDTITTTVVVPQDADLTVTVNNGPMVEAISTSTEIVRLLETETVNVVTE